MMKKYRWNRKKFADNMLELGAMLTWASLTLWVMYNWALAA